jgi:hypothetical protein
MKLLFATETQKWVRPKSHQPLDKTGTRLRRALKAGERLGAIYELLRRG